MMQGIAEVYYKYASKIAMVFYLNLLWILFSCLGLVVLGIAPATAVLYKLSAKVLAGEEFPIFKTYLEEYKNWKSEYLNFSSKETTISHS